MESYFRNTDLLQNTLLPYFYDESLKILNTQFSKLDYKKYLTHLQPHGTVETYYRDTKTIQERVNYKNGKLSGLSEEFYKPKRKRFLTFGHLKSELCYKYGKILFAKYYYNNGKLSNFYNYKDGKSEGLFQTWYKNGKLHERSNYKNDTRNGLYEYYYTNGQLRERCTYKNNELHGLLEEWDYNGQLIKKYMYKYGWRFNKCDVCIYFINLCMIMCILIGILTLTGGNTIINKNHNAVNSQIYKNYEAEFQNFGIAEYVLECYTRDWVGT